MLNGPIHDDLSNSIVAQLLFLESENPDKQASPQPCSLPADAKPALTLWLQISLYINSPGGSVSAGLAIYDTMQVRCVSRRLPLTVHGQLRLAADLSCATCSTSGVLWPLCAWGRPPPWVPSCCALERGASGARCHTHAS